MPTVSRTFLKPQSITGLPQGDFEFTPIIIFLEDTTMAGLQAQLVAEVASQQNVDEYYYVLEEADYQVTVVKLGVGMNPAEMNYSVMLRFSEAKRS